MLDASRVDDEIARLLLDNLVSILVYFPSSRASLLGYSSEVKTAIASILAFMGLCNSAISATPGMRLFNLKVQPTGLGSSFTGGGGGGGGGGSGGSPKSSVSSKVIFRCASLVLVSVASSYAWRMLGDLVNTRVADARRRARVAAADSTRTNTGAQERLTQALQHQRWFDRADAAGRVVSVVHLALFLAGGSRGQATLAHVLCGLRVVDASRTQTAAAGAAAAATSAPTTSPSAPATSARVDASYLNRELAFYEMSELFVALYPLFSVLIDPPAWIRRRVSATRKDAAKTRLLRLLASDRNAAPSASLPPAAKAPSSDVDDLPTLDEPCAQCGCAEPVRPYVAAPCGCSYCYFCLATRCLRAHSKRGLWHDGFARCAACGEKVESIVPLF
ncbi:peroxisome biogenesis protein 2 [Pycnococcus provasolii]